MSDAKYAKSIFTKLEGLPKGLDKDCVYQISPMYEGSRDVYYVTPITEKENDSYNKNPKFQYNRKEDKMVVLQTPSLDDPQNREILSNEDNYVNVSIPSDKKELIARGFCEIQEFKKHIKDMGGHSQDNFSVDDDIEGIGRIDMYDGGIQRITDNYYACRDDDEYEL